ncbi:hypothetical protein JOB18_037299 [Solea senegalensis]|uniref:Uncharacterized protein n=1 Tax=Solea senegalensis TaxID=28829 RepID=A0AAV6T9M7_SOLSE|nr:hypothetical protein JOB18_037299 [Solea senegalensis]
MHLFNICEIKQNSQNNQPQLRRTQGECNVNGQFFFSGIHVSAAAAAAGTENTARSHGGQVTAAGEQSRW